MLLKHLGQVQDFKIFHPLSANILFLCPFLFKFIFLYLFQMNLNSMQFISHRDSIASDFASQTEKSSSMLSSRRRLIDDEDDNDLEDFKQEIQYKFIRSVANKIYTYPLNEEGFDLFDDEQQFHDLVGISEYNLFQQDEIGKPDVFKKQQFKIKNPKVTSKSASTLLQTLKSERQRLANLRNLINESLQPKKESKNGIYYIEGQNQSHNEIQQEILLHNYRKKRLNTEPYQKPMGFIIKRK